MDSPCPPSTTPGRGRPRSWWRAIDSGSSVRGRASKTWRDPLNSRDSLRLSLVIAAIAVLLGPVLFTHQVYFTEDLTNINHPWRVLVAESLQRGGVPLWNPYSLFGMPLLGNFQ